MLLSDPLQQRTLGARQTLSGATVNVELAFLSARGSGFAVCCDAVVIGGSISLKTMSRIKRESKHNTSTTDHIIMSRGARVQPFAPVKLSGVCVTR